MANGVELGTAYLSLIASTNGLAASVRQGVGIAGGEAEKGGKKAGGRFAGALKVAALAGAVGAGVAVAKAFGDAVDAEKQTDRVSAALGLNSRQSARAGKVAGQLYAGAWGGSMEEVTGAVESVMSSIDGMSRTSPARLKRITAAALDIAAAFEIDVEQAATNAGVLMKTGLAKNAGQAMDLITASLQKVPKALRGEVMDATEEYSQFFASLGYTGPQAMGLLVSATEDGQYGIDKMGDSIKEFTIRSTDMSETTKDAYEAIGLNSRQMTKDLLGGGETAREAFNKIIGGLKEIKDPAKQSQAALALFGTPLEDLGTSEIPKFLEGLSGTEASLGKVRGAASRMGETLNDNLGTKIEGYKRTVQVFASDALAALIKGFETGKVRGEGFMGAMSSVGAGITSLIDGFTSGKVQGEGFLGVMSSIGAGLTSLIEGFKSGKASGDGFLAIMAGIGATVRNVGTWLIEHKTLVLTLVAAYAGFRVVTATLAAYRTVVSAIRAAQLGFAAATYGATAATYAQSTAGKVGLALGRAQIVVTKGLTIAQRAFNLVLRANPIGLVITAIGALVAALVWFFTKTKAGQTAVKVAWAGIKAAIKTVADWWTKTAWPAIRNVITAFGAAFRAVGRTIGSVWTGIRTALSTGWNWIRDRVFAPLKNGVARIGDAFRNVKDAIKRHWDALKEVAARPVNFVLGTVYNGGIRKWVGNVFDFFGKKNPLPEAKTVAFARGGVLPGYTPGRDVHQFYSPTGGRLALSGGEAIMRPEFARAVGGAAGVARLNAAARTGKPMAFKNGGIWDDIGGVVSNIGGFMRNPVGAVKSGLGKLIDSLVGRIPGGEGIRSMLAGVPRMMIDGFATKLKSLFGGGAGGGGKSGVRGVNAMTTLVKRLDPTARISSGYRPGARTASGYPSYHGMGRAIDIVSANMGRTWDLLRASVGGSAKELYYSGRQFLRNGKVVPWRGDHWDHVHLAMANGGIVPKLYDQGGWLPTGVSVVENRTGKPEPVFTGDQFDQMVGARSPLVGTMVVRDERAGIRELERMDRRAAIRQNMYGRVK